ncbi:MAG: UDP-GlcNAc:undecaprenyl-phosphate/decaprenyl-phosphate GlcNAc-phosphate transferase [Blastocatellia bacterium]|jgi:UDP-GlcNAc:undecaprenyl-phosphate GlcNAc-1-phosphate transferase|nr:UDP-GlcNAc:undecaprenyl-phosphate/decaprenyl-phosphate GlcNAc-phosphate transferase [Blastocatellia bacterium]
MISFSTSNLIPPAVSLVLALALTPVVRALARRWGFVAKPKVDRWHKNPTAMMGGVGIWLAVMGTYLTLVPHTEQGWVVVGAASFLFLVGLADDWLHVKPYQKLIGQVVGAAVVVNYGLVLPWTRSLPVNMLITIFWLIGITNAINLLDNMDGLATGIAAIASCFLTYNFLSTNQPTEAMMMAVFAAALLGFLVYNSNPASIFMGDSGSMFIGFFLAGAALVNVAGGRSRSFVPVLAVPILVLFIPIFDTTFVTILRKLSGRAASQGGRDHTSHRLVALGMSERRAVWMLYGLAGLSGLLAIMVSRVGRDGGALLKPDVSLALLAGFTLGLTLLGVYLAGVKGYDEEADVRAASDKPLFAFLVDFSYKRRIFEVLLDVVLIVLAYWSAYAIKFEPFSDSPAWKLFLRTLPVLVVVRLAAFLFFGVYRGIWRYTSIDDLMAFAKAVATGSLISMAIVLFKFRFQGFSRAIFVIDALVMMMLLAGSRVAFRFFRQVLPTAGGSKHQRALIYGAGDAGELLLRELLNNRELSYAPIGFIDDDPKKQGKVIHGFRVFGGNGMLGKIISDHQIEQLLISTPRISEARLAEILRECEVHSVELKRMSIRIESVSDIPLASMGRSESDGDL